jgi:hypothetical protein
MFILSWHILDTRAKKTVMELQILSKRAFQRTLLGYFHGGENVSLFGHFKISIISVHYITIFIRAFLLKSFLE